MFKGFNYLLSLVLILLIAFNIFYYFYSSKSITRQANKEILSKYPFLSSKILAEGERDLLINFIPLRKSIKDSTKEYEDSFSVYFEYLPTGVSIGINEKKEYYAASLIKVPLAMAFLNSYRRRNLDIKEVVKIIQDDLDPKFGDLYKRGAGAEISLDEILKLLLTESDNTAYRILARRTEPADFKEIYDNLDIELNTNKDKVYVSTKSYSSILKSLYYASTLSKDDSQYLLGLLVQNKYEDKIRAGIPRDIPIANKIGVLEDDKLYQDCGIIYVPKRPYLLCMISQSSEDQAKIRMNKISQMIYDYIKSLD